MIKSIQYIMNFFNNFILSYRCSICMESILLYKQTHKLSCGHTFHSNCIMSWFRSKNNTCPYCRCTGMKEEDVFTSINGSNPEVIQENSESNKHVSSYVEIETLSREPTIEAYYIRAKIWDLI